MFAVFQRRPHTNLKNLPFSYKKSRNCRSLQFFSVSNELLWPLIYTTEMMIPESVTSLERIRCWFRVGLGDGFEGVRVFFCFFWGGGVIVWWGEIGWWFGGGYDGWGGIMSSNYPHLNFCYLHFHI